ncbi:MAG: peptidoglycan editing factor PgeF [Emcibacter sp.]|nr:peptidoglycan editing factor PgeF [Emcibacter sp.]
MTPLTSSILHHPTIRHGFYTRKGGYSTGLYNALNCAQSSDDITSTVMKNRQAVRMNLNPNATSLCGLSQIHSNIVHFLDKEWDSRNSPKGDAMVTKQKNIALAILTADCAPVLFSDPINGVIAAAHAGWKGAKTGILENTLDMMCLQGAERHHIAAAIGPAISQENYEVGPEFIESFTKQKANYHIFFKDSPKVDHHFFDLKAFVQHRLKEAGLHQIATMPNDTYADQNNFFSYRRSTHKSEKDYGRQISVITIL